MIFFVYLPSCVKYPGGVIRNKKKRRENIRKKGRRTREDKKKNGDMKYGRRWKGKSKGRMIPRERSRFKMLVWSMARWIRWKYTSKHSLNVYLLHNATSDNKMIPTINNQRTKKLWHIIDVTLIMKIIYWLNIYKLGMYTFKRFSHWEIYQDITKGSSR